MRCGFFMRTVGVEPIPLARQEPKSCASANSAKSAYMLQEISPDMKKEVFADFCKF